MHMGDKYMVVTKPAAKFIVPDGGIKSTMA
jgi:hypothetical protein